MATTAIGSVAAMSVANTNAGPQASGAPSIGKSKTSPAATINVLMTTAGSASEKISTRFRQNSPASSCTDASYSSPGRKTANNSSLVSGGGWTIGAKPSSNPATTRATVYGMPARGATSATTAAMSRSTIIEPLSDMREPVAGGKGSASAKKQRRTGAAVSR
jgi:hypothetical protein